MQNIIEIRHHVHDYECMWNGIEDLYMNQTGEESLPEAFFFLLSGFGSFCYLKTEKDRLKRMVALGDGRTRKMYEFLAPFAGFEYRHHSYKRFEGALKKAKEEIDAGFPVVLGALDMYYLPYYKKLYHNEHIPFHYVLMAGYDDEQQCIYLYDCGKAELLSLSYEELRSSMKCSYPGLSRENTVCTVRITGKKGKYQIAREALAKKCELFLEPKTGFLGYKGFSKFIRELPAWRKELEKEEYDKIFLHMVTFFGTVPTVPNRLKGINEPDSVTFRGGFDKMERMLRELGEEFHQAGWLRASEIFAAGQKMIESIAKIIISYLAEEEDEMDRLPGLFREVLDIMTEGFLALDL